MIQKITNHVNNPTISKAVYTLVCPLLILTILSYAQIAPFSFSSEINLTLAGASIVSLVLMSWACLKKNKTMPAKTISSATSSSQPSSSQSMPKLDSPFSLARAGVAPSDQTKLDSSPSSAKTGTAPPGSRNPEIYNIYLKLLTCTTEDDLLFGKLWEIIYTANTTISLAMPIELKERFFWHINRIWRKIDVPQLNFAELIEWVAACDERAESDPKLSSFLLRLEYIKLISTIKITLDLTNLREKDIEDEAVIKNLILQIKNLLERSEVTDIENLKEDPQVKACTDIQTLMAYIQEKMKNLQAPRTDPLRNPTLVALKRMSPKERWDTFSLELPELIAKFKQDKSHNNFINTKQLACELSAQTSKQNGSFEGFFCSPCRPIVSVTQEDYTTLFQVLPIPSKFSTEAKKFCIFWTQDE